MRIAKSTKLTKARIKTSLNVTENTIFIKKCQGAKGMRVGFCFSYTSVLGKGRFRPLCL